MTSLDETRATFLLVVARRIVPEAAALDEAGLAQMLAIIDLNHNVGEKALRVGEALPMGDLPSDRELRIS